jgi:hypothetical protein
MLNIGNSYFKPLHGSVTEFENSTLQIEANMSQQPIPLETLTTSSRAPVEDNKTASLRSFKTGAARTLLSAIVPFVTLLSSGCTNGGGGERANAGASFISRSEERPDGYGMGFAAENGAFVDWTKPARNQPGPQAPMFGGRAEP